MFTLGQSILEQMEKDEGIRIATIRIFNYAFTMGQMILQLSMIFQSFRKGDLINIKCFRNPRYLDNPQEVVKMSLMPFLLVMLICEPVTRYFCDGVVPPLVSPLS